MSTGITRKYGSTQTDCERIANVLNVTPSIDGTRHLADVDSPIPLAHA